MPSLLKNKSLSKIIREWDAIASLREKQIKSGKDHSANHVLAPAILHEVPKNTRVVDIGCGTGWLTSRVSKISKICIGIDPSTRSIEIAQRNHSNTKALFFKTSVEQFVIEHKKFETAISNMAASSAPNLETFINASRQILKRGGVYIMTIPHPCFWPLYWGYASNPKFKYEKTFAVADEFRIQRESSLFITTHFHHPLEQYIEIIRSANFVIERFRELQGREYSLPRFLLLRLRAV